MHEESSEKNVEAQNIFCKKGGRTRYFLQKNERKSEFCARIADNLECIIADYFEVILSLVLTSVRLVVFELNKYA